MLDKKIAHTGRRTRCQCRPENQLLCGQADSELTPAQAIRDKTEKSYDQNDAALKAKRSAAVAELNEALNRVPVDSLAENLKIADRHLEATQIGIALAVVLIFVEYGFRNSLLDSNVLLIQKLNADLAVVSGRRAALPFRESFARHRLTQIAGLPGVISVHPLYMEYYLSPLRNPAESPDKRPPNRPIRVIGVDNRCTPP
jgi:hypothetical protein